MSYQARSVHKRAGVQFDLVGLEGGMFDHAPIIGGVAFGRCAEQVRHEVRMRFEAEDAGELEGLLHAIDADASMVRGKDVLVQALNTHLQLRAA